jgi:Rad3-related DNA helicase
MMSATIVDKTTFCSSLGIKNEEAAYLSIPSPFPVENRPIHYLPVGAMSKNAIDSTLPKLAEVISLLLEKHKNDKGIIHAANYKIARYIQENLKTDRLMIHDSTNRDEVLKRHIQCDEPTVLLSPSMMEGVDLYDNLSRFQIICKVPFPFLGDLVSVKRKDLRKNWYEMQTVKLILQSVGRSIRNENDHASTYILDDCFSGLYSKNKWMFPEDFQKSMK